MNRVYPLGFHLFNHYYMYEAGLCSFMESQYPYNNLPRPLTSLAWRFRWRFPATNPHHSLFHTVALWYYWPLFLVFNNLWYFQTWIFAPSILIYRIWIACMYFGLYLRYYWPARLIRCSWDHTITVDYPILLILHLCIVFWCKFLHCNLLECLNFRVR